MADSTNKVDFLDMLAAPTPTPGGGSAAAHTGAAAAALTCMIARLTVGKEKYENVREEMESAVEKAEAWRAELSANVQRDAEAFDHIISARRQPRDTPEQAAAREKTIESATYHAASVPLQVARTTLQVMEMAVMLAMKANINAISDAGAAAALARAAITASGYNVKINLLGLEGQEPAQRKLDEIQDILSQTEELHNQMKTVLEERGGIT